LNFTKNIKVYTAISFSLATIVAIFITLPLANNYINNLHLRVQHEMDFCKVRIRKIFLKIKSIKISLFLFKVICSGSYFRDE